MNNISLTFPRYTIKGAAARMADIYAGYIESPWQFLAMGYLTCLGSMIGNKVSLMSEIRPQPRLYTAIIGESADDRKSESIRQVTDFFYRVINKYGISSNIMHSGESVFKISMGVGSAEGLAKSFGTQANLLLVYDELKAFVSKSQIEGSILLPCVNTLFDKNTYHSAVKKNSIIVENAYLSVLGACTKETYQRMWTAAFLDIGFINRLFLVTGKGERRFSLPQLIPDKEKVPLETDLLNILQFVDSLPKVNGKYLMPVNHVASMMFDNWYLSLEPSIFTKRLDTYGHRLLILSSINEMESKVTTDVTRNIISLLNWELNIRRTLDPDDTETILANLQKKILGMLSEVTLSNRELQRSCHSARVGTYWWKMALKGLVDDGQIFLNKPGKYELVQENQNEE